MVGRGGHGAVIVIAEILGQPAQGGILLVADHASATVPDGIDLGIAPALLTTHIAVDLGVAAVARALVAGGDVECAYLATVSRLVVDLNRDEHAAGLIPEQSDGHEIPGNAPAVVDRARRISRYYTPYHDGLAALIARMRPAFILSVHSFTPCLSTQPGTARPWPIGILYNQDDRLARVAIASLDSAGVNVGDQLPYSGRDLNYTMNRHAEGNAIPYLGIEMRQDEVADDGQIAAMAGIIGRLCRECRNYLALNGELRQVPPIG